MRNEPQVVAVERDFIIVHKPAGMHSAPLRPNESGNLLAWVGARFPDTLAAGAAETGAPQGSDAGEAPADPAAAGPENASRAGNSGTGGRLCDQPKRGFKPIEGGLVHRLDRDTSGLLIIARSLRALLLLSALSAGGGIEKTYRALCSPAPAVPPGFPPNGPRAEGPFPLLIRSRFRPYGRGRKAVRPVFDPVAGREYETIVASLAAYGGDPPLRELTIVLRCGFRHQIRAHLASLGLPILGDELYGGRPSGRLHLHAESLSFRFPGSRECRYSFPPDWVEDRPALHP